MRTSAYLFDRRFFDEKIGNLFSRKEELHFLMYNQRLRIIKLNGLFFSRYNKEIS